MNIVALVVAVQIIPILQGPCGRSPKRRGSLRFLPPLEVRPSSVAPDPVQSWDRRVRPRLVWRNGTPLDSRVVHGVTGHLSICMWNLWVFLDDAPGCHCPFVLCLQPQGCLRRGVHP